jgi:opacity protein-like surface antigen
VNIIDGFLLHAKHQPTEAAICAPGYAWGFASFGAREFSNDETRTGWVAGGGIEYMFNRNWTAKVEGLYADFGSTDLTVINPGGQSGPYTSRFQHTVATVRAGLNWKW